MRMHELENDAERAKGGRRIGRAKERAGYTNNAREKNKIRHVRQLESGRM